MKGRWLRGVLFNFCCGVSVNTVDALSAQTPFGGMKQPGFGGDLSLHSLDKYTALKTIWIKYRA
jgi:gamma-glutamyl-gamma-aminobutyraldehyde dehydrogenase